VKYRKREIEGGKRYKEKTIEKGKLR